MKGIFELLKGHAFFQSFRDEHLKTIAGCGKNAHFKAGEYLAREGDAAEQFFILRQGRAVIELNTPPRGVKLIQTLRQGDIAGWSWLYPPYQWNFDVKATEDLSVTVLDGKCLRQKCETDHDLGYCLMKAFAKIMTDRLKATRLQLLDIYGKEPSSTSEAYRG